MNTEPNYTAQEMSIYLRGKMDAYNELADVVFDSEDKPSRDPRAGVNDGMKLREMIWNRAFSSAHVAVQHINSKILNID